MKLTVLVDNNTLIDRYFLAEPAVSFFIETEHRAILFDTGYSGIFLANAAKMGIDLFRLDTIVLSHAHLDHTWGLQHLIQAYTDARFENRPVNRPTLVAHPWIFHPRIFDGIGNIGTLITRKTAQVHFDLQLSRSPVDLGDGLVFLGEIERTNDFEAGRTIGKRIGPEGETDDDLKDDSALAFSGPEGLVVITGCAHAGICNTVAQAMKVCARNRIADIIGGFHLLSPPETQMTETVNHFRNWRPGAVHACHCTDWPSRMAIAAVAPLHEVGVGLQLTYPSST